MVIGLMAFGFFGRKVGFTLGGLALLGMLAFSLGFLRGYPVLLSSLTAYGVSTVVCVLVSLFSDEDFDFDCINERVVAFHYNDDPVTEDEGVTPCPVLP